MRLINTFSRFFNSAISCSIQNFDHWFGLQFKWNLFVIPRWFLWNILNSMHLFNSFWVVRLSFYLVYIEYHTFIYQSIFNPSFWERTSGHITNVFASSTRRFNKHCICTFHWITRRSATMMICEHNVAFIPIEYSHGNAHPRQTCHDALSFVDVFADCRSCFVRRQTRQRKWRTYYMLRTHRGEFATWSRWCSLITCKTPNSKSNAWYVPNWLTRSSSKRNFVLLIFRSHSKF